MNKLKEKNQKWYDAIQNKIISILAEEKCTVAESSFLLRNVSEILKQTTTVQKPE